MYDHESLKWGNGQGQERMDLRMFLGDKISRICRLTGHSYEGGWDDKEGRTKPG